ncbi:MAG: CHAT domain-containing protein, partial [Bryobacteraceae bacterium]
RWLRDVLAAPPGERTVRGLVALAAAFKANQVEDAERALANVSQAQPNVEPPAALRVEAEYIHAVHRARRLSKCVERASAAEQKAADGGYFWIAAQVGIDLGNCRSGQGDYGGAYEDLERALQRARKAGYRILELRADGILAATRTSAGNLVVIWDQGQASLKKFWAGAYAGVRAQQVYYNLQRASEISDWPYAAQAFGRASVESIAGSRYRLLEAFGRTVVAGYAKRTGSLEEAAQEFDRAERLFEDLGTSKVTQEHRMTAQIDIAKADTEIGQAKAAFDRLSGLGKQVLSIDSTPVKLRFHGALGEALSRLGRSDEAEAAYLSARQLSEVHLASMKAIDQRADVMRIAPAAYLSLVEEHWNRHDFVRALQAWEWYRNGEQPGSHEVSNLHTSGLHRETFVAYAYLPRGLVVWVFDDRGIHGEALNVEEKQLKAAAYRFLRLCADRASNEAALQHEAWRLYDWLVRPIAHRLEAGRTIVVMPDGVISAIPLQAILDPESRYLGERFPVVSASSLADYQRRAKARSVYPDSRALVVANPALGQDVVGSYPPLPQTIIEGRHVAGRFRGSILLTGPEATLAAVDEARPKTEILHFAGHGFSNADNGGLLLAPAGTESQGTEVLEGKRLAGQDWTMCRLAVLSACSGGTGEARGPMNPESLVRRLLWAGVSRVVASRWNVDSENGVVLMDAFYSALLSGLDVPAALRQSARRVREQKATSHPYYWAGFQAFGSS